MYLTNYSRNDTQLILRQIHTTTATHGVAKEEKSKGGIGTKERIGYRGNERRNKRTKTAENRHLRFSRTCLPVRENRDVVSLQTMTQQWFYAILEQRTLCGLGREHVIEREG